MRITNPLLSCFDMPYGTCRRAGQCASIYPIILPSQKIAISQLWLYCDDFIRLCINDTLLNVYYAFSIIPDPWSDDVSQGNKNVSQAHLWWNIQIEGEYLLFTTANISANREVQLKQSTNIAGLERIGGTIDVSEKKTATDLTMIYTRLHIPMYSAFIKEN